MPNDQILRALDRGLDQLYEGMQRVDLARLHSSTKPQDAVLAEGATRLAAVVAAARLALMRVDEGRPVGGPKDGTALVLYRHMHEAITTIADSVERADPDTLPTETQAVMFALLGEIEKLCNWLNKNLEGAPNGEHQWFEDLPVWPGNGRH